MEGSGLGGGFLSGPTGGLIDLESPIHRHQHIQMGHPPLTHQHPLNMMSGPENGQNSVGLMEMNGLTLKNLSMNFSRGKAVASVNPNSTNNNVSEEDEPSFTEDGNGENVEGFKCTKGSTWQRMKWTDDVVRLLIAVVACVGDDSDGREGPKRKSGILQKKGKWKTVSKVMMSKGCHVSPQQCEDKFNDLNKRYKRLNDILGRGTSCRVVENPALMDSMPHLSTKAKEDVKKILSSKHLFYKEMCAYHNGQKIPDFQDFDLQGCVLPVGGFSGENNSSDEEAVENNDSEDDESENEDNNKDSGEGKKMVEFGDRKRVAEEDGYFWQQSIGQDTFQIEMAGIFQDPTKSPWEKKEWIKKQMLELQEQRVNLQAQAFELEKQRMKWLRYCSKKDRELERMRLENEQIKIENERRVLQLKHKELEIEFRRSEASFDPTSFGIGRMHGREQIDLVRHQ